MNEIFRTVVKPEPFPERLSYHTPALFLGSCFSSAVGAWLEEMKFPVVVNPSGVLYNPASIAMTLERMLTGEPFREEELIREQERWISLKHDTSFSGEDKTAVLRRINRTFEEASVHLQKTKFLFITFGTARVWLWKESGMVVANCHKLPADRFERRLLETEEIVTEWRRLLQQLWSRYPEMQVVFTVSPIRHRKDGATGNQVSKAILHVATHRLLQEEERLHYFPAYEIVMDDLRDYRFYAADMLHLSETATDYVRSRFREAVIAPEALPVMAEVEKIRRALAHRPLRPASGEYRKFREAQLKKIEALEEKYPFLDLSEEKMFFE